MSKRLRNTKRSMIIEGGYSSGTSISVPFCAENVCDANNKNRHEGIENFTASHEKIPQSQNKRQKCAQNRSSADIIMAETETNENRFDNSNQIGTGQAFYQRSRQRKTGEYVDLGDKDYKCIYCDALFWFKESIAKKSKNNEPLFTLCCQEGKIKLPITKPTPVFLEKLLDPIISNQESLLEKLRQKFVQSSFKKEGCLILIC
ncbi:hypothetical protein M0R45_009382 [Rubus argutus]|uniref:Uncharacterized protein n=1 Tax=Rubus argutus TaxID=59490 RepID=A0AAW1Y3H9_RUBAR